jgi:hypothetical protein
VHEPYPIPAVGLAFCLDVGNPTSIAVDHHGRSHAGNLYTPLDLWVGISRDAVVAQAIEDPGSRHTGDQAPHDRRENLATAAPPSCSRTHPLPSSRAVVIACFIGSTGA